MERSGTLAEPSDNSTTPYIKKRPTLLGQPLFIYIGECRLQSLCNCYSYCNGSTYHRVVTHSEEAHHLNVCRN